MAENEVKIIKYTITRLLSGREHSKCGLLKKLLQRDFERHLCLEWIDKFNQHNLLSKARFAESLIRERVDEGIGELRICMS
jgi:regulatory protein